MQPLFLILCFLVGLVGAHNRCLSENLVPNGASEGQEQRGRVWDVLKEVQDLLEGCPAQ